MKRLIAAAAVVLVLVGCADYPEASLVRHGEAPVLEKGQEMKVVCWNVQYMAGTGYVFWYDEPDNSGPDSKPSKEAMDLTVKEVARVLNDEDPDVIMLQELDVNAKHTDYRNQIEELRALLSEEYPSEATAFYHNVSFVPEKHILGRAGMTLTTFSKYRIDKAVRHQLPQKNDSAVVRHFDFRRCILETQMPVSDGSVFSVMNTHMTAFTNGDDVMARQVAFVKDLLSDRETQGIGWIFGGDTNLLPPGAYDQIPEKYRPWFNPETELTPLTDAFPSFPSLEEATGEDRARWQTIVPNDHYDWGPCMAIDFLFHSPRVALGEHRVRQEDTQQISDHLPLTGSFRIP